MEETAYYADAEGNKYYKNDEDGKFYKDADFTEAALVAEADLTAKSTLDDIAPILDLVGSLTNIDITLDAAAWADGNGAFAKIVKDAMVGGKVTWTDVKNAAQTAVTKDIVLGDDETATTCVEYTVTVGEGDEAKTVTLYKSGDVFYTADEEGKFVPFTGDAAKAVQTLVYTFGVANGNDLVDIICDIAAPLESVLNIVLFGGRIEVLPTKDGDAIAVTFGSMYNYALLPLFEALGIDAPAAAGATLETVLKSVIAFVDTVCAAPVESVIALLGEASYFISIDGLSVVIENLVKPILEIVTAIEGIAPLNITVEPAKIDFAALLAKEGEKPSTVKSDAIVVGASADGKTNFNIDLSEESLRAVIKGLTKALLGEELDIDFGAIAAKAYKSATASKVSTAETAYDISDSSKTWAPIIAVDNADAVVGVLTEVLTAKNVQALLGSKIVTDLLAGVDLGKFQPILDTVLDYLKSDSNAGTLGYGLVDLLVALLTGIDAETEIVDQKAYGSVSAIPYESDEFESSQAEVEDLFTKLDQIIANVLQSKLVADFVDMDALKEGSLTDIVKALLYKENALGADKPALAGSLADTIVYALAAAFSGMETLPEDADEDAKTTMDTIEDIFGYLADLTNLGERSLKLTTWADADAEAGFAGLINKANATTWTELKAYLENAENAVYGEDEDGNEVITGTKYDFDIDSTEALVAFIKELVAPIETVVGFIMDGEAVKLFADGDEVTADRFEGLQIKMVAAYNYVLVPLFEALGVSVPAQGTVADGKYISAIIDAVVTFVKTKLLTAPVETVVNMLGNLLNFIASEGITVILMNLVAPINEILKIVDEVVPVSITVDLGALDLSALLEEEVGDDPNGHKTETIDKIIAEPENYNVTSDGKTVEAVKLSILGGVIVKLCDPTAQAGLTLKATSEDIEALVKNLLSSLLGAEITIDLDEIAAYAINGASHTASAVETAAGDKAHNGGAVESLGIYDINKADFLVGLLTNLLTPELLEFVITKLGPVVAGVEDDTLYGILTNVTEYVASLNSKDKTAKVVYGLIDLLVKGNFGFDGFYVDQSVKPETDELDAHYDIDSTQADVDAMLEKISALLPQVLELLGVVEENGKLADLVNGLLYTDKMADTIATAVVGLLASLEQVGYDEVYTYVDGEETKTVYVKDGEYYTDSDCDENHKAAEDFVLPADAKKEDIKTTMSTVTEILGYVNKALNINLSLTPDAWAGEGTFGQVVGNKTTWTEVASQITEDAEGNKSLGLTGVCENKTQFIALVSEIAAPLSDIIAILLGGEGIDAFGIKVSLGNAYNDVIIPLYEALGIAKTAIVAPVGNDYITAILSTVLGYVDALLSSEDILGGVLNLVGNLADFIANKGLEVLVKNLISPVNQLLVRINKIIPIAINIDLTKLDIAALTSGNFSAITFSNQTRTLNVLGDLVVVYIGIEAPESVKAGVNLDLSADTLETVIENVLSSLLGEKLDLDLSELSFTDIAKAFITGAVYNKTAMNVTGHATINGSTVLTEDGSIGSVVGTYNGNAARLLVEVLDEVVTGKNVKAILDMVDINGLLDGIEDASLREPLKSLVNDVLEYLTGDVKMGAGLVDIIAVLFNDYDVKVEFVDQVVAALSTILYGQSDNSTGLMSSNDEVNELIAKLDTIIVPVLRMVGLLGETETLADLVGGLLYTDDLADTLVGLIVNAFAGMEETMVDAKDADGNDIKISQLENISKILETVNGIIGTNISLKVTAWAGASFVGSATSWIEVRDAMGQKMVDGYAVFKATKADESTVTLYKLGDSYYTTTDDESEDYVAVDASEFTKIEEVKTFALGIDTKAEFINLVDEIAKPFASLLNILLGDDGSIGAFTDKDGNGIINLKMGSAYRYALVPLFKALGITNIVMPSDETSVVKALLTTVLDYVDVVLANPVQGVLNLVGNLANFIANDGLTVFVANLIAPVNDLIVKLAKVLPLSVQADFSKLDLGNLLDGDKTNDEALLGYEGGALTVLGGVINVFAGKNVTADMKLGIALDLSDEALETLIDQVIAALPTLIEALAGVELELDIDFSEIAAEALTGAVAHEVQTDAKAPAKPHSDEAATKSFDVYDVNGANVVVELLRTVLTENNVKAILGMKAISDLLDPIIEKGDLLGGIVGDVVTYLKNNVQDSLVYGLVDLLVELISEHYVDFIVIDNENVTPQGYDWSDRGVSHDDTVAALQRLSTIIKNALPALGLDLAALVSDNLYTADMQATIVNAVFGLFKGFDADTMKTVTDVLAMVKDITGLEISLTPDAWKTTALGSVVGDATAWADVAEITADKFTAGKDSFINTVSALLMPFDSVLALLLDGGEINGNGYGEPLSAFDAITIYFGSAYNYAVIPLLEGLGITGLKTQAQYRADAASEGHIKYILEAVLGYVDTVLGGDLVAAALNLVANLAYLVANDGLTAIVENLIAPINTLLKSVDSIIPLAVFINLAGLEFTNDDKTVTVGEGDDAVVYTEYSYTVKNAEDKDEKVTVYKLDDAWYSYDKDADAYTAATVPADAEPEVTKAFGVKADNLLNLYIAKDHDGIDAGLTLDLSQNAIQTVVDNLLKTLGLNLKIDLDFAKIASAAAKDADNDGNVDVTASATDTSWDNAILATDTPLGVLDADIANTLMSVVEMILTSENIEAILDMLGVDLNEMIDGIEGLNDEVKSVLKNAIDNAVSDPMNLIEVVIKLLNGDYNFNADEFVLHYVGDAETSYEGDFTDEDITKIDNLIITVLPTIFGLLVNDETPADSILITLKNAIDAKSDDNDIKAIVDYFLGEYVVKGSLVDTVVDLIIPLLASLDDKVLDIIKQAAGLDLSAEEWAAQTGKFADFVKAAKAADDTVTWALVRDFYYEADAEGKYTRKADATFDWGVTDVDSLVDIFVEILAPLSDVLDFVLLDKSLTVFSDEGAENGLVVPGLQLYTNVIALLADALGLEMADTSTSTKIVESLVDAILGLVDDVCASPFDTILTVIGSLTFFVANDGVDALIDNVLNIVETLLELVSSILPESEVNKLLKALTTEFVSGNDMIKNLLGADYIDLDVIRNIIKKDQGASVVELVNNILASVEIGEEGDKKALGIQLPTTLFIDIAKAVVVELDASKNVVTDKSDWTAYPAAGASAVDNYSIATVQVLYSVLKAVLTEDVLGAVSDLIGAEGMIADILDAIANGDDPAAGLLDVLTMLLTKYLVEYNIIPAADVEKIDVLYDEFGIKALDKDADGTESEKEATQAAIEKLDTLVGKIFESGLLESVLGEAKSLEDVVAGFLYTDNIADMLVELLVPVLAGLEKVDEKGNSTMKTIQGILEIVNDEKLITFNGKSLGIDISAKAWAGTGAFGKFIGDAETWTEVLNAHFDVDAPVTVKVGEGEDAVTYTEYTYKAGEETKTAYSADGVVFYDGTGADKKTVEVTEATASTKSVLKDKTFGINDKDSFVSFIGEILKPLDIVFELLLDGGALAYNGAAPATKGDRNADVFGKALSVVGAVNLYFGSGYNYAILPLLEGLGYANAMSQADFNAAAAANGYGQTIIDELLTYVGTILTTPVQSVLGLVANLADLIAANGLTTIVSNLIAPINTIIGAVDKVLPIAIFVDITKIGAAEGEGEVLNLFIGKEHQGLDAGLTVDLSASALNKLISSLLGSTELSIDLDFNKIAAQSKSDVTTDSKVNVNYDECLNADKTERPVIGADTADTFIALLSAILTKENVEAVLDMLDVDIAELIGGIEGLDEETKNVLIDAINNALENPQYLIGIIINILNGNYDVNGVPFLYYFLGEAEYDYTGDYGDNWNKKVNDTIKKLDAIIVNLVPSLLPMFANAEKGEDDIMNIIAKSGAEDLADVVEAVLNNLVLKDSMLDTIFGALIPVLAGLDANIVDMISTIAGINLAPAAFAQNEGALKAYIGTAKTWADVLDAHFTKTTEGTGEEAKTVYTAKAYEWGVTDLDSFLNVIEDVLTPLEGVLGFILKGEKLAVLDSVSLKGVEGYEYIIKPIAKALGVDLSAVAADATCAQMITSFVKDLITFVENDLCEAPLVTVFDMLGNLVFFVANNGITNIVDNVLAIVEGLLSTVESVIGKEDVNTILSSLTKGNETITDIFGADGITLDAIRNIAGDRGEGLIKILNTLLGGITIKEADAEKGTEAINLTIALKDTFFVDYTQVAVNVTKGHEGDTVFTDTADMHSALSTPANKADDTIADEWNIDAASSLLFILKNVLTKDIIEMIAGLIGEEPTGTETVDELINKIFTTLAETENTQDLLADVIVGLFEGYEIEYVTLAGKNIEVKDHFTSHNSCEIEESDLDEVAAKLDKMIGTALPKVFKILKDQGIIDAMEDGDIKTLLQNIVNDPTLTNLPAIVEYLLNNFLYTDSIANMLFGALVPVLAGLDASILDMVSSIAGIDLAPQAFAKGTSSLKKYIGSAKTWADVRDAHFTEAKDAEGKTTYTAVDYTFGISGEADFKALITDIITPLNTLIEFLFLGKDLKVLGYDVDLDGNGKIEGEEAGTVKGSAITLTGVDGYDQVVLPLFDALGLYDVANNALGIKSAYEMRDYTGAQFINYVLDVVLAFVDQLAEAPVTVLLSKIAGLLYFVISDGVYDIVTNLVSFVDGVLAMTDKLVGEGNELRLATVLDMLGLGFSLDSLKYEGLLDLIDGLTEKKDEEGNKISGTGILKANGITAEVIEKLIGSCGSYVIVASLRSNASDIMFRADADKYAYIGGTQKGVIKTIQGTPAKTLMGILDFVCDGKDTNGDKIVDEGTLAMLKGLIAADDNDPASIVNALLTNLSKANASDYVAQIILKLFTKYLVEYRLVSATAIIGKSEPQYSESFTKEKAEALIEKVDTAIADAGVDLMNIIMNLLGGMLGDVPNMLLEMLVPMLAENEELLTTIGGYVSEFSSLSLDLTVTNFKALAVKYTGADSELAKFIGSSTTWAELLESRFEKVEKVNEETGEKETTYKSTYNWAISELSDLTDLVIDMLRPLDDVLKLLLMGGTQREPFYANGTHNGKNITVLDELAIMGGDGYNYAIIPLLEALSIDKVTGTPVKTQAEYEAYSIANGSSLKYVIDEILALLDGILSSDNLVTDLLGIIANLAYFVANDGLDIVVANLIQPLNDLIVAVAKVLPISIAIDLTQIGVEGGEVAKIQIGDVKAGSELGVRIDLTADVLETLINGLAADAGITISFEDIACGTVKVGADGKVIFDGKTALSLIYDEYQAGSQYKRIEGDAADTLQYILDLIGQGDLDLGDLDIGAIIDAVLNLLANAHEYEAIQNRKLNPNGETLGTKYSAYISETNANIIVDNLDNLIAQILNLAGVGSLEKLLGDMLATNANINSILNLVVGLLSSEDVANILEQIPSYIDMAKGIVGDEAISEELLNAISFLSLKTDKQDGFYDILKKVATAEGNASAVKDGVTMSNALRILGKANTWADLNGNSFDGCTWGFKDGDIHGFLTAITEILTPLNGLLKMFTMGDPDVELINVFDILSISGGKGYDFAIIPLLEALSIDKIPTQGQYEQMVKAGAGTKNIGGYVYKTGEMAVIGTLITALEEGLLNKLFSAPSDTLLKLIPNFAYFMANDGLTIVYRNLVSPVYGILCAVSAILGGVIPTELDVAQMVHDIDLGTWVLWSWIDFKIPVIDWLKLAREGAAGTIEKSTARSQAAWSYNAPTLPITQTGKDHITQYVGGKYVDNGANGGKLKATQTYIVADKADVLVTVLRWALDLMKDEHNRQALTDWISGLFGLEAGAKEIVRYGVDRLMQVSNEVKTTDVIIGGLFSALVTFIAVSNEVNGKYDYVQKILNDIFSELSKCDKDCWYANVADAMQTLTGCWKQTIGTDDDFHGAEEEIHENLSFWQRIVKWFQELFAKIRKLFGGK